MLTERDASTLRMAADILNGQDLTTTAGFVEQAIQELTPPPAPAPLPCPVCRSANTRPYGSLPPWTVCNVCGAIFDPDSAKPCPECAEARELASMDRRDTERAIARMKEAAANLAAVTESRNWWKSAYESLETTLEARP